MHCCACSAFCMHVGGPWYCLAHTSQSRIRYYILSSPIITAPNPVKCDICGSTAIDHTEAQCQINQNTKSIQGVRNSETKPITQKKPHKDKPKSKKEVKNGK